MVEERDQYVSHRLLHATHEIFDQSVKLSDHTGQEARGRHILLLLALLMGFASLSTDVYLPAIPAIGRAFEVGIGQVEWSVSSYLAGFAIGQLLWGPVGDRYGRLRPIAVGLVLFVIGSAACALAASIGGFIAGRLIQALGASASVVLARAMVRDLYEGSRAASVMSTLMLIMTIAPLLGPLVGEQILAAAGWRAIFLLLVGVGIVTLSVMPTLGETLPLKHRIQHTIAGACTAYGRFLLHRQTMLYVGASSFFYAGMFAYISGSPHAFIVVHHIAPKSYGLLFAAGVAGIMLANLVNARTVGQIGSDRLLGYGGVGAMISGLVLAAQVLTDWGGLIGLTVPLFLFASMAGFVVANSIVGALTASPANAGSISALIGAAQYGAGMVGSGVVGAFADGTARAMAIVIAGCGVGTFVCTTLTRR